MIEKKICMLGSFAVGKTSLVTRFVTSIFSDRYLTTIGVKIDKKIVSLAGRDITLIVWDIHGDDEFQRIRTSYLRGASGYLLVVDGTRRDTLATAMGLRDITCRRLAMCRLCCYLTKPIWQMPGRLTRPPSSHIAIEAGPSPLPAPKQARVWKRLLSPWHSVCSRSPWSTD